MAETTKKVRTLSGTVVSDAMDKTAVVAVTRTKKHPIYHKYHKVTTKFHAHDEDNSAKVGDTVTIKESRPRSKNKRWEIVS